MKYFENNDFRDKLFEFDEDSVFIDANLIRREITKMLLEIGIALNCQGFRFLRESVMLVIDNPMIIKSTTKHLYPAVGKLFDTKGQIIERSIRHSCDNAFDKTYFSTLISIFGLSNEASFNYKPSNSELIALIAEAIKLNFPHFIK